MADFEEDDEAIIPTRPPPVLTDDEQLALAGLLRVAVRLDGQFSAAERGALDTIAEELFAEEPSPESKSPYRGALADASYAGKSPAKALGTLLDRAARELPDDESVRNAARAVKRPYAREILYGAVYSVVAADTITSPEWMLLNWLEREWDLKATDELEV